MGTKTAETVSARARLQRERMLTAYGPVNRYIQPNYPHLFTIHPRAKNRRLDFCPNPPTIKSLRDASIDVTMDFVSNEQAPPPSFSLGPLSPVMYACVMLTASSCGSGRAS